MLRDIPNLFLIILVCFVFIFTGVKYQVSTFQVDSSVTSVSETLRATIIANRDDSSRVKEGTFKINKANFEKDFKKRVISNGQFKDKNGSLTFDYLEDDQGNIKGVKVKVKDDKNTYQATSVLDVASK